MSENHEEINEDLVESLIIDEAVAVAISSIRSAVTEDVLDEAVEELIRYVSSVAQREERERLLGRPIADDETIAGVELSAAAWKDRAKKAEAALDSARAEERERIREALTMIKEALQCADYALAKGTTNSLLVALDSEEPG